MAVKRLLPLLLLLLLLTSVPQIGAQGIEGGSESVLQQQQQQQPDFTRPVSNESATVGREAKLTCYVRNAQNYKIAWIRVYTQTILSMNEQIISRNHRYSVSHNEGSKGAAEWRLTIRDAKPLDQGWYMCQINSNPMKSAMGFLEIKIPPNFESESTSKDVTVREGESSRLSCRAKGNPAPQIKWQREDKKKIGGVMVGDSIVFGNTSRSHQGAYLCVASNGIPPTASRRIALDVLHRPSIQLSLREVLARKGERVQLNCSAKGNPAPSIFWQTRNGLAVENAEVNAKQYVHSSVGVSSSLTLVFSSNPQEDFASYQCFANNSEGSAVESVTIHVQAESVAASDNGGGDAQVMLWNKDDDENDGSSSMQNELNAEKDSSSSSEGSFGNFQTNAPAEKKKKNYRNDAKMSSKMDTAAVAACCIMFTMIL